jgi:hypothetical protein
MGPSTGRRTLEKEPLTPFLTPVNTEEETLYYYVFLFSYRNVKCYVSKTDDAIEKVQYMYQCRNKAFRQSCSCI